MARAPSPTITGVIGVCEMPVLKPSASRPALNRRVFSHSRSISAWPSSLGQQIERCDAGGGDGWRVRGAEQQRPRAMLHQPAQLARAGHIAATAPIALESVPTWISQRPCRP